MLVEPVFIVGCPRSGTSLVAAHLDRTQELAVTPETHFFPHWLKRFPALGSGRRSDFDDFWRTYRASAHFRWLRLEEGAVLEGLAALDRWDAKTVFSMLLATFAETRGRRRVGEKTPAHYRSVGQILEWYPTARIVVVVRDPRAVVASYFELAERVPWARGNAFDLSRRWKDAAAAAQRWQPEAGRVTVVTYEALVSDPSTEFKRLLDALGLVHDEAWLPDENRWQPAAGGGLVPGGDVSAERVDRWRQRLPRQDVQVIERVCGRTMKAFGYEVETRRSAAGLASVAAQAASMAGTHGRRKLTALLGPSDDRR